MLTAKSDIEKIVEPMEPVLATELPVSKLLAITGNSHTYQKRLLVLLCIMQVFYSCIYVIIPILFYIPKMYCLKADGSSRVCPETEACSNPLGFTFATDRVSLVTKFHLVCSRKQLDLNGKNTIFVMAAVGCLLISTISDYLGRKMVFLMSCLTLVAGTFIGLSSRYNIIIGGISLCYLAMELFINFAAVYSNETVGGQLRSRFMGIIYLCGSSGVLFSVLLNVFFTSYEANLVIPGAINGLLVFAFCYLVETPYFLAKVGNRPGLYASLSKINEINHSDDKKTLEEKRLKLEHIILDSSYNPEEAFPEANEDTAQVNDAPITKAKLYFTITCLCLICANLAIMFSLINISLQRIGNKNIKVNGVIVVLSSAAFVAIFIKYAPRLGRRASITQHNIAVVLICTCLLGLKLSGLIQTSMGMVLDIILSTLIVSGALLVNCLIPAYVSELLPTRYRGMACGIELFISKMSYVISTYFDYAGQIYSINPLVLCALPALISLVAARALPETNRQK